MRATVLAVATALVSTVWLSAPTTHASEFNAEPQWRHATSLTGSPKYPEGYTHFDYVNADAPQGGVVRLSTPSGFDTFNPLLRKGNPAPGLLLINETLMTPSYDEISSSAGYGLIADAVRYPDDYSWVEYRIDPNARFHDGKPVTTEDVIWSLDAAKSVNPLYEFYYKDVVSAEDVGDGVVRFNFARAGNRELPHILGQLQVLPKHWWTGTTPDGRQRSIENSTLEPPLGSGPYKIGRFEPNRSVEYVKVDDYWAEDHPTQVGKNNFDTLRYEVYLDQSVLLEAFKGDRFDFRSENSAKNWALGYDFPAVRDGRVVKEVFPDEGRGVMQAFVLNLRLDKFKDPRVRRALNLLYDFESQKETIFFGQYDRIASYFEGTELAARGLPEGRELEILEEVRDLVPASVFTEPYENPVNGNPQNVRTNAREAVRLFREAGYEIRNGKMVNAETGEPFTIELVDNSPTLERVALPYQQSLARIGVDMTLRIVDTSQYINRLRNRDFEMTVLVFGQSLSPGNEQLEYWGSEAADRPSSQNYMGIQDPGVDALIEKVILAEDREDLVAATKALDRVLLHNHFMVPQYYSNTLRTARWDRFGHPDNIPPYTHGFPTIWWWDEDKATKVGSPS
ncbi:MAG: extracellular solute-binding protein [Devosia sp.]